MNAFALATSRRALVIAAMLVASTCAVLLLTVQQARAATGSGPLSCRASAIRTVDSAGTQEPIVANPQYTTCQTDNDFGSGPSGILTPGLQVTGSREAHTLRLFGNGFADAEWGNLTVRLGTLAVKVDVLQAEASSTCANGLKSSSSLARVRVGTQIGPFFIPTILNLPLVTQHLVLALPNGVTLELNDTDATNIGGVTGVRQQALVFTTPNTEVVLGEAMAGGTSAFFCGNAA